MLLGAGVLINMKTKFVVASVQVLDQRVPGTDYLR
jgi:hypothetical protein